MELRVAQGSVWFLAVSTPAKTLIISPQDGCIDNILKYTYTAYNMFFIFETCIMCKCVNIIIFSGNLASPTRKPSWRPFEDRIAGPNNLLKPNHYKNSTI